MTEVKSGFKKSEFWLTLFGTVAGVVGVLPPPYGPIAAVVLPGIYALGRSYVYGQQVRSGGNAPITEITLRDRIDHQVNEPIE